MGNEILEFMRISEFRMCENYLPKLKIALEGIDNELLWNHERDSLNSIGGIVLHIGQHIQRHVIRFSNSTFVEL
jgi:hypothetical protein